MTADKTITDPKLLGPLLLDTGILLLRSGASSNRINIILQRMASAYNTIAHIDLGAKSISLSLQSMTPHEHFHGTRNTPDYGVNFTALSGVHGMSEAVHEKPWPLNDIKQEVDRLKGLPHYPRALVLFTVACAGAAFCRIFGGDLPEMGIVFGATLSGLFAKQELLKKSVNTYICTFLSALVAALFTGVFFATGLTPQLEHANATCILFLVPGVPLLNFFIDLIAGNILYALERGINALIHIMAIALGLAAAAYIYYF